MDQYTDRMPSDPSSSPPSQGRRPVDEGALARWRQQQDHASAPVWLHAEVGARMAERLSLIKQPPRQVLIWGRAGGDLKDVAQALPDARCVIVDTKDSGRAVHQEGLGGNETSVLGRLWSRLRRASGHGPPSFRATEVPPGEAQLVWSNMGLHTMTHPVEAFRTWHRALAVDGFVMFSTLGPGTLPELRSVYERAGWGSPMAPLVDMHDLGDMLAETGFADPVVDQETLTLTWSNAADALAELRSMGRNAAMDRFPGLRTPRWQHELEAALEERARDRGDGRVSLSFEVVYGHAFKPLPRVRMTQETTVPVDDLRALVRGGRRRSGSAS